MTNGKRAMKRAQVRFGTTSTRSFWLPSLLAALALACSPPAEEGASPGGRVEAHTRELRQGLVRVAAGDGTFSYRLPADLVTPDRKVERGITWRYQGQAAFAAVPVPARAKLVMDAPQLRDRRSKVQGTVSIDEYGRRWMVEDLDDQAIDMTVGQYGEEVRQLFGDEADVAPPAPPAQSSTEPPQEILWKPLAWNLSDCDGDGKDNIFAWDTDDRIVFGATLNDRQKKVLLLASAVGSCSGTMVDDEWLLTAAHCVTDSNGNAVSLSSIDACTYGNDLAPAQCFTATSLVVAGGWNGSGVDDDYAVVRLSSSPGVGWMAISQASDSIIENARGYNVGYPGWTKACASQNVTAAQDSGLFFGRQGFTSDGDVTGLSGDRIRTRLDVGTGHSGGPYYYYPSGCCGAHFLTGVATSYVVTVGNNYNGGPKGPAIRDWVAIFTP